MVEHLAPDVRKLLLGHLAVRKADPRWVSASDSGGAALDCFDAVMQIVNLSARRSSRLMASVTMPESYSNT